MRHVTLLTTTFLLALCCDGSSKPFAGPIRPEIVITELSLDELQAHCKCEIWLHPMYEAARVSLQSIEEFMQQETACGVLGVDRAAKKGWLFQSDACRQLTITLSRR